MNGQLALLLFAVLCLVVVRFRRPAEREWWARFLHNRRALQIWAVVSAVLLALNAATGGLENWYNVGFSLIFAVALGLLVAIIYTYSRRSSSR